MMFQILLGLVAFGIVMFATTTVLAGLLSGGPDHYPTVQSFRYLEKQIGQLEKHQVKSSLIVPYYMTEYNKEEDIPFYQLRSNFGACKENELCLCKNFECTRTVKNGKINKKYKFTVNLPENYFYDNAQEHNVVKNIEIRRIPNVGQITEVQINPHG